MDGRRALGELERMASTQKKAVTVAFPATATLLDFANGYLDMVAAALLPLIKAGTGNTPSVAHSVTNDGPAVLLFLEGEMGSDTVAVTLNFTARKLQVVLTAESQGGATVEREWMIGRIQGLPHARIAHLIWNVISK